MSLTCLKKRNGLLLQNGAVNGVRSRQGYQRRHWLSLRSRWNTICETARSTDDHRQLCRYFGRTWQEGSHVLRSTGPRDGWWAGWVFTNSRPPSLWSAFPNISKTLLSLYRQSETNPAALPIDRARMPSFFETNSRKTWRLDASPTQVRSPIHYS